MFVIEITEESTASTEKKIVQKKNFMIFLNLLQENFRDKINTKQSKDRGT